MKLTTKRNWRYFWRELFQYMIPMILIVGTIDVFTAFVRCPLHPEWSAPCSANWILAAIYGFFLLIVVILAIISSKMLRKVKKKIEEEFVEAVNNEEKIKKIETKKFIAKSNKLDKKADKKKFKNNYASKNTAKKKIAKK